MLISWTITSIYEYQILKKVYKRIDRSNGKLENVI